MRRLKEERELREYITIDVNNPYTPSMLRKEVEKKITALVRAVREECAKVDTPRYSGDASRPFWNMVKKIKNENDHNEVYLLGCDLQNLEGDVLKSLRTALDGNDKSNKLAAAIRERGK